jgi:hypothetical protein
MRFPIAAAVATLLLPLSLPALSQTPPEIPSLSQDEVSRVNRGEVIVNVIEGAIPVGDAIGVIDATPQAVMAVLADIDHQEDIFDDTSLSEVVGHDGDYILQHGITDTPWPMADREWTIRVWQGPMEVDGMQVLVSTWDYVPGSGNLVDTHGYYLLVPWGDQGQQTLLRYHISVDLGTWLPRFLLDWSTENMLPDQITALRRAVAAPAHAAP